MTGWHWWRLNRWTNTREWNTLGLWTTLNYVGPLIPGFLKINTYCTIYIICSWLNPWIQNLWVRKATVFIGHKNISYVPGRFENINLIFTNVMKLGAKKIKVTTEWHLLSEGAGVQAQVCQTSKPMLFIYFFFKKRNINLNKA